eukprot:COSAG04_NODE_1317_length_7248_cov_10.699119_1_plen_109_part_00
MWPRGGSRRPDIVCVWGGVRYVIDITIAWKTEVGHVEERDVGHDADKKAADKERKYKAAMKRQLRGLPGWLANVRLEGRGRVACLRRSGDRGFEGNSSSEAETASDSM